MGSLSVVACLDRDIALHRTEPDAAQRTAALRLDALASALQAQPRGGGLRLPGLGWLGGASRADAPRGLYLWGSVGRGKTYLLDLFYSTLDFPARERTHFYRFMRDVHAELNRARHRTEPLQIVASRLAARARLICLDEFFVGDIADAMILGTLLEALFAHGVTLVATSNQPPSGLYPDGLQRQRFVRAIDMLERHMEVLHIDGPTDYRLRQLASADTYLDASQPDTAARLQRLFETLTQGTATGPVELQIGDRTITASCAGAGAAWFEFATLCAGARSADDYIELARLYPTVFLSRVPCLSGDDDDAARRFVMLVDEFYDRGVKLVVSADAPPATLYRGARLGFEFERTASRLVEMQSQQYLSREHRA